MRRFGFKMNVLRSCCPAASKSQGTFDLQDIWKHQIPSLILINTTNASFTLDTRQDAQDAYPTLVSISPGELLSSVGERPNMVMAFLSDTILLDWCDHGLTQPTKVAGSLRRAVRSSRFAGVLGGRHMECAYYFDFCRLCPNQPNQPSVRIRFAAAIRGG